MSDEQLQAMRSVTGNTFTVLGFISFTGYFE